MAKFKLAEFFVELASIGVWMRLAPLICGMVGVGLSLSLVGADKWEEHIGVRMTNSPVKFLYLGF